MTNTSAAATSAGNLGTEERQGTDWALLGVLVLAQMLIWLDNSILNVVIKTLADPVIGLGASPGQLEWSISAYTLFFAALLFTGGALGDRWGYRRMLVCGLVVFASASSWAAFAGSPQELIAARTVMGIGSALLSPSTLAIIMHAFAPQRRARAIAVWAGSSGVGIAIGPLTAGALLEHFWWGSAFLVNVPVVVICLIGIALFVP